MISRELIQRYQDLVESHGAGFWWSMSLGEILEGTTYKVWMTHLNIKPILTWIYFRRRIT